MSLTLALAQIAPLDLAADPGAPQNAPDSEREHHRAAILRQIAPLAAATQAAARADGGEGLLLLPELVLPGYNRPKAHAALAEPAEGGAFGEGLAALARAHRLAICYGWAERAPDGRCYNAASVLDAQGRRIGHYRKLQLFGALEHASFTPGAAAPASFAFAGRRLGLLICYDIEFPEHARVLARQGCDLLLVPTANPQGYPHVPDILVPARAYENRLTIAYANYAGDDCGLNFAGGSVICGPDGQALARAGRAPGLLIQKIPAPGAYDGQGLSSQLADLRQPYAAP